MQRKCARIIEGLQLAVEDTADGWSVTAPSARFDIEIEADLIEEVVRLYGYDRVPSIPGTARATLGSVTESTVPLERLRATLAARGYQEAITYSFVERNWMRPLPLSIPRHWRSATRFRRNYRSCASRCGRVWSVR